MQSQMSCNLKCAAILNDANQGSLVKGIYSQHCLLLSLLLLLLLVFIYDKKSDQQDA